MGEERFVDLECKLAYLESQIVEMSDVIHGQWKEIEVLKSKLIRAENKIESLQNVRSDSDVHQGLSSIEIAALNKPPHY